VTENEIGSAIVTSAMKVHSRLGPGLLESAYGLCLAHELRMADLTVSPEVYIPIKYGELVVDKAYRIDLLVENRVVIELKVLEAVLPVHKAQLLSYLRLGNFKLGYLLNFHVTHMRDGVSRMVNGL
jgi:GxxExxY protein